MFTNDTTLHYISNKIISSDKPKLQQQQDGNTGFRKNVKSWFLPHETVQQTDQPHSSLGYNPIMPQLTRANTPPVSQMHSNRVEIPSRMMISETPSRIISSDANVFDDILAKMEANYVYNNSIMAPAAYSSPVLYSTSAGYSSPMLHRTQTGYRSPVAYSPTVPFNPSVAFSPTVPFSQALTHNPVVAYSPTVNNINLSKPAQTFSRKPFAFGQNGGGGDACVDFQVFHNSSAKPTQPASINPLVFSPNINNEIGERNLLKTNYCYTCNTGFTTKRDLEVHMLDHFGMLEFSCDKCMKKFSRKDLMLSHRSNCKGMPTTVQQPLAGIQQSLTSIKEHSSSIDAKLTSTTLLGQPTETIQVEDPNIVQVEEETSANDKCHDVEEQTIESTEIAVEEQENIDPNNFKYVKNGKSLCCPTCKKFYSSRYVLNRHMKIHCRNRRFKCAKCGSRFEDELELDGHKYICKGKVKRSTDTSPKVVCHSSPSSFNARVKAANERRMLVLKSRRRVNLKNNKSKQAFQQQQTQAEESCEKGEVNSITNDNSVDVENDLPPLEAGEDGLDYQDDVFDDVMSPRYEEGWRDHHSEKPQVIEKSRNFGLEGENSIQEDCLSEIVEKEKEKLLEVSNQKNDTVPQDLGEMREEDGQAIEFDDDFLACDEKMENENLTEEEVEKTIQELREQIVENSFEKNLKENDNNSSIEENKENNYIDDIEHDDGVRDENEVTNTSKNDKTKLVLRNRDPSQLNMMYRWNNKIYPCSMCDKSFTTIHYLKLHMSGTCRIGRTENVNHMLTDKKEIKVGKNRKVGRPKGKKRSLDPNVSDMNPQSGKKKRISIVNTVQQNIMKYRCTVCNEKFQFRTYLSKHMLQKHTSEITTESSDEYEDDFESSRVVCEHCQKTFSTEKSLKAHYRKYCHILRNKTNLKDERDDVIEDASAIDNKESNNSGKLVCEHCQKTLSTEKSLKAHYRKYCHILRNKTNLKDDRDHVMEDATTIDNKEVNNSFVSDKGKMVCDQCEKTYSSQSYLITHQQSYCRGKIVEYFECEFCGKRLSSARYLEIHKEKYCKFREGIETKEIQKTTSKDHLNIQKSTPEFSLADLLIENGRRVYVCKICDVRCISRTSLKIHLSTHSDEDIGNEVKEKDSLKGMTQLGNMEEANIGKDQQKTSLQVDTEEYKDPIVYYVCMTCKKNFDELQDLKSHMVTHPVCKHKFAWKRCTKLAEETQTNLVENNVTTSSSANQYKSDNSLDGIIKSHIALSEQLNHKMKYDMRKRKMKGKIDSLNRLSHNVKIKSKSLKSVKVLRDHQFGRKRVYVKKRTKRIPENRYCKSCDRTFTRRHDLVRHYETNIHLNSSGSLVKEKDGKAEIKKENQSESDKENKTNANSKQKEAVKVKTENSNLNIAKLLPNFHQACRYKCTKCPKAFKEWENFRKHLKRGNHLHRDFANVRLDKWSRQQYETTIFVCNTCQQEFNTKYFVKKHIAQTHLKDENDVNVKKEEISSPEKGNENEVKPEVIYKSDWDWLDDTEEKKKFKCQVCSKRFANSGLYREHTATHTKEFKCTYCNKDFGSKMLLNTHVVNMHKKFSCTICPRRFVSRKLLKYHMTRCGKRFHACGWCKKMFTRPDHVVRHQKKSCPKRFVSSSKK